MLAVRPQLARAHRKTTSMNKKKMLLVLVILLLAGIIYTIVILSTSPFWGDPVKGIVYNPKPTYLDCDTSRIVEIKCFRFEHVFGRKHFAYNEGLLCLKKGQHIIIDHDVDEMENGVRIRAKILRVDDTFK